MRNKISDSKVRERLLGSDYGKFDLIDTLYSKEEILNCVPRVLLKNIMERFSIPKNAINRKTYWSWLQRYKKRNKGFIPHGTSFLQVEKSGTDDWQNFEPSNAESLKQSKTIIKLIK